jgi:hypothetical protein
VIVISQNSANTVIVTVTELTTISNPVYLFVFYREELQGQHESCIAQDSSPYPDRYNEFTITDTSSPTPLNGEVNLIYTGASWYYEIYAQTSTTNLDPALADELVEQGKVVVVGTETPTPTYTYNPTPTIYVRN